MTTISYRNGNCNVSISEDGTKIREFEDVAEAEFPESLDVKITNYCEAGCSWCHEQSTTEGRHARNLRRTTSLLTQLPPGVEVAIGGGNPLSHDMLPYFCIDLKNAGIIANITVNALNIRKPKYKEVLEFLVKNKYVNGVGYSITKSEEQPEILGQHAVAHIVIGVHSYKTVLSMIEKGWTKFLLLGYKQHGRGKKYNSPRVADRMNDWYRNLDLVLKTAATISFDQLAINQLYPKRYFANLKDYDAMYMGEEGQFSMYLDAVEEEYSICSYSSERLFYGTDLRTMFKKVKTMTAPTFT